MAEGGTRFDPVALVTLREVRRLIRASSFRGAVVLFGVLYVLGALFNGGMLVLAPLGGGYTTQFVLGGPFGQQWWRFPALLVVAPWGVLTLPMFATIAMVAVAIGVGLGMAVAAVLVLRLLRPRPEERARENAVGALTGLTPAMLSLVTLGACCSTTAAATAGIGLVADASATTVSNVLYNDWYLGVFQIVVVWASLFAQELLLTVYRGLTDPRSTGPGPQAEPPRGPWLAVGGIRTALFVGGLLLVLSVGADWTAVDPMRAGPGAWFSWIVQYAVVGVAALGLALFPLGTIRLLARAGRSLANRFVPGLVALAGTSLLVWLPPPFPAWGLSSVPDQVLGAFGALPGWGAAPVAGASLPWLLFRWVVVMAVPAAFVLGAALRPDRLAALFSSGLPRSGVARETISVGPTIAPSEPVGQGRPDADGT